MSRSNPGIDTSILNGVPPGISESEAETRIRDGADRYRDTTPTQRDQVVSDIMDERKRQEGNRIKG
ncbi:MAG: hypothetical protein JO110_19560 [Acetobacteraceae bacterium]|nr:hypothetical protein [Acetobacteraceae bacterium]